MWNPVTHTLGHFLRQGASSSFLASGHLQHQLDQAHLLRPSVGIFGCSFALLNAAVLLVLRASSIGSTDDFQFSAMVNVVGYGAVGDPFDLLTDFKVD